MRSSASGGSKRGAGWVVPTPRQSHWPTTSPRSAHWPLRAQCQPTGIFIWKSLHRRGECPQSRSRVQTLEGPLLSPHPAPLPREGCPSTPPGRSHCPTRVHILVLKGPQPHSTLCLPSWAHIKSLRPPTPHGEHQEDRPGLVCPVCGTWWPGRSMEQWPWLGL